MQEITEEAKEEVPLPEKPLDDRRLDYVRTSPGTVPQTPSNVCCSMILSRISDRIHGLIQLTKSISKFLKESRKRNDASNRSEFLLSLAEKRRKLNEEPETSTQTPDRSVTTSGEGSAVPIAAAPTTTVEGDTQLGDAVANEHPGLPESESAAAEVSTCARTDAKPQNRDMQMKYDIAKNEDGPLKRTMKGSSKPPDTIPDEKGKQRANAGSEYTQASVPVADRHPGLASRFKDIETHLAVRYGELTSLSPLLPFR